MPGRDELIGQLFIRAGLASSNEIESVAALQQSGMPMASLCYALGFASEEALALILARKIGLPAVVLDRSRIQLDLFDGVAADLAIESGILPLSHDDRHLFVACAEPWEVAAVLSELEFIRGKKVIVHVALKVTLLRTLYGCLRAKAAGRAFYAGPLAGKSNETDGGLCVVSDAVSAPPGSDAARAQEAVIKDVTKEVVLDDILAFDEGTATGSEDGRHASGTPPSPGQRGRSEIAFDAQTTSTGDFDDPSELSDTITTAVGSVVTDAGPAEPMGDLPLPMIEDAQLPLVSAKTWVRQLERGRSVIDLDGAPGGGYRPFRGPPGQVLVIDDDMASRNLLDKALSRLGYQMRTARSGVEALDLITEDPPDVAIIDMILPEVSGFSLCRAIKRSHKYRQVGVVLISAVADSAPDSREVTQQSGADAFFQKPIRMERLTLRVKALLAARGAEKSPPANERAFRRALSLVKAGEVDEAVEELRRGIEGNPMSAKHHFVLANLLHKSARLYEAIDEYEATLELRPDFFPALTRLAYLYYRQGYAARAIETWRRALPLCQDDSLRQNIETFMRKVIVNMREE